MTQQQKYADYLKMLRRPFTKLCRLRFLQPDGSTAFTLDNHPDSPRAGTFLSDGILSGAWQNGRRRTADVTLSNLTGEYDYQLNGVWFGSEIALDEGLVLSNGENFYIQQGVFLIEQPVETLRPAERTVSYHLVDKCAALDGSLGGNLEGTYEVPVGTNIFAPIAALLQEDRGNGFPVDSKKPVFTGYYNGKTQVLPDGSTVALTDSPYTLTVDGQDGTKWDVISELAGMLNAWVGYDETGALRLDPSQDDISDADKPVLWNFSMAEASILGAAYTVMNSEVFNDFIVVGEQADDYSQPRARAQILDPRSPVNVYAIGRKTKRVSAAGFATNTQCRDYAVWMLKRASVLQRAVTISCTQMMHIHGNDLVTLTRTDKKGSPVERHLVQGFTRPLSGTGEMTIDCTSVNDFPEVTVTEE